MSCSKVVPTFVMLLLVVGIGGMIGAAYGSYWYTDTKFHTGLWRSCINETNCQERNYILQFAKVSFNEIDNQAYDIVLMLIVVAGGLGCVSLVFAMTICCIQRPTVWKAISSGAGIITLAAVVASIFAVVWAEMKLRREYKHGWSSILAYVGCGGFILAFILSIAMCCTPPNRYRKRRPEAYEIDTEFSYTPGFNSNYNQLNNNASKNNTGEKKSLSEYANVGFQLK